MPKEFCEDVGAVARRGDGPIRQIARDFGISESCLRNWLQAAGPPAHDVLVRRDFTADRPNELWFTDITEHPTAEGKLHLCAIKDVFSNRNVGYSISDRMRSRLAVDALASSIASPRR